jgi:hypothetical protein
MFFFAIAARPTSEPAQPHVLWVPGAHSLEIKQTDCHANWLPETSAKVWNSLELYLYKNNNAPVHCSANPLC